MSTLTSEINQFQDEVREGYVPEKKTAPDYGEPWKPAYSFYISDRDDDVAVDDSTVRGFHEWKQRDRAIECVNACAGMTDPSAEIQAMREAIKEIYAEADAYADGASDASAHDKFCNEIAAKLKPFIKP
jgi:hypothetical protein